LNDHKDQENCQESHALPQGGTRIQAQAGTSAQSRLGPDLAQRKLFGLGWQKLLEKLGRTRRKLTEKWCGERSELPERKNKQTYEAKSNGTFLAAEPPLDQHAHAPEDHEYGYSNIEEELEKRFFCGEGPRRQADKS
jgi:hypothetical protein